MSPPSRAAEFWAGVRAEAPLLLGVAPFGMAYGAYAVETGLSVTVAQAMSVIVFGGASQFVAARLIEGGAAGIVVVLSGLLVNLRHALYSASLAPYLDHLPLRWRAFIAYLLTDEAYAASSIRFRDGDPAPNRHWFVAGACVALWVCWQATTAAGVFAGAAVPDSWDLDFALPVTFIALLVPALRDRPSLLAAAVAGTIALIGYDWGYSIGLFAAAIAGMAAGLALERSTARPAGVEAP